MSHRRYGLMVHLICAGLLGVLSVVPAEGSASARDIDPVPPPWSEPAQDDHGTDRGGHDLSGLDEDPWQPEPPMDEPEFRDVGASLRETPGGTWDRPVFAARISAAYGIPGNWIAGHHTGVDLTVPVGTPVYSVGPGVVVRAGWGGDYGRMVLIRMDDKHYTLFAHLSRIFVSPGKRVTSNTLIGLSGNSGRSSGPHLHFEVRKTAQYGSDIHPLAYLVNKGVRV